MDVGPELKRKGSSLKIVLPLLIVLGGYVVLAAVFNTLTPLMVVPSGSMDPALRIGDLILVRGEKAESLEVGDVIAFNVPSPYDRLGPSPVIHRVVRKWVEDGVVYFQTRGDANPTSDPYDVPASNVVGKYTGMKVPYVGHVLLFIRTPAGLVLILFLAALSIMSDRIFRRR